MTLYLNDGSTKFCRDNGKLDSNMLFPGNMVVNFNNATYFMYSNIHYHAILNVYNLDCSANWNNHIQIQVNDQGEQEFCISRAAGSYRIGFLYINNG